MLVCSICKLPKSKDEFYFYRGYREKRCIPCRKEVNAKWQRANLDKKRIHSRKAKYGLTHAEYLEMVHRQNNKCTICGEEMTKPYIDHDHKTGRVRELLCSRCNTLLGYVEVNKHLVDKSIEYLDKHR